MLLFFSFFFFSFWLFRLLFYFFFTRLCTSTKAKILFLNSHQRARKVPVTRIIPTNSTLPFAWSKISTKEFQCVHLVIWQSKLKSKGHNSFSFFTIWDFDCATAKDHWHVSSLFTVRFVGHKWAKTSNCLDSLSLRGERGNDLETGFFMTRGLSKWSMIINQPRRVMHVIENKTSVGYAGKHHQWSEIIAIKTAHLQLLLDLLYNFYWSSNEVWLFYFFYFPR